MAAFLQPRACGAARKESRDGSVRMGSGVCGGRGARDEGEARARARERAGACAGGQGAIARANGDESAASTAPLGAHKGDRRGICVGEGDVFASKVRFVALPPRPSPEARRCGTNETAGRERTGVAACCARWRRCGAKRSQGRNTGLEGATNRTFDARSEGKGARGAPGVARNACRLRVCGGSLPVSNACRGNTLRVVGTAACRAPGHAALPARARRPSAAPARAAGPLCPCSSAARLARVGEVAGATNRKSAAGAAKGLTRCSHVTPRR